MMFSDAGIVALPYRDPFESIRAPYPFQAKRKSRRILLVCIAKGINVAMRMKYRQVRIILPYELARPRNVETYFRLYI
jgi:hypothetical protein